MRSSVILACVMAVICFVGSAYAIEGGASVVDTLSVEAASFDHVGTVGGILESEVAVKVPSEDWSIIAGVNFKSVDPDWETSRSEGWGGELGVKYYFTRLTSLALVGSLEEYDYMGYTDVVAGTLSFKQRFAGARSGVSPCVNLALGVRHPDYDLGNGPTDTSSLDYIMRVGAGCDFMISDTLAMVFDVEYCGILESLSRLNDRNDGLIGRVSFTAYWD
jgi:hypothetical protein